ncbi:MAG: hypothetical protein Q8P24_16520 [Desulfobacterales bacterium]|nr:hypothetical protein [Desulfobacterales bacterium]
MQMKRQGDLLLMEIPHIPFNATRLKHRVLAEGEVTGHFHELDGGIVYEVDGRLYFRVEPDEKVILMHPEHGYLTFEPGCYSVKLQREYIPAGPPRRVAD